MDVQAILVGLIVIGAIAYIGKLAFHKLNAFSTGKNCCQNSCGCSSGGKKTKLP